METKTQIRINNYSHRDTYRHQCYWSEWMFFLFLTGVFTKFRENQFSFFEKRDELVFAFVGGLCGRGSQPLSKEYCRDSGPSSTYVPTPMFNRARSTPFFGPRSSHSTFSGLRVKPVRRQGSRLNDDGK